MEIKITIPSDMETDLEDIFAKRLEYINIQTNDPENLPTKKQFMMNKIVGFIRAEYISGKIIENREAGSMDDTQCYADAETITIEEVV